MAEYAYRIDTVDGKEIKKRVCAKYLTDRDRDARYECCGYAKDDSNKKCNAKVSLIIPLDGNNSFAARGHSKHIPFCIYDESKPSKEKRVSRLDPVCKDKTDDDILKRIAGKTVSSVSRGHTGKVAEGTTDSHETRKGKDSDDESITITTARKIPGNANELFLVLSSRGEDAVFAGKKKGKWLIGVNEGNIPDYVKNGLDNPDQIAMVIMQKTGQKSLPFQRPEKYFAFLCQDGTAKLYFLIPSNGKIGELLFVKHKEQKEFAVIAKWRAYPGLPNTYYCDAITPSQVAFELD